MERTEWLRERRTRLGLVKRTMREQVERTILAHPTAAPRQAQQKN